MTTIRITKNTHTEIWQVINQLQARTGKIPTLDDALKELLENNCVTKICMQTSVLSVTNTIKKHKTD